MNNEFDYTSVQLRPDYEGDVTCTLISSKANLGNRESVLYLHGYIDYFFHPHVSEQFIHNNIDFYALDLRKYGRSLLAHQHPNYCMDMKEYYEDISMAINHIKTHSDGSIILLGHSTGGLLASAYMNDGDQRDAITKLVLNSPFLEFNQPKLKTTATLLIANIMSFFFPYSNIKGALSVYAQSIHKDYHGEWDFNLKWKPIEGFPTYFKWIVAIHEAHKKLLTSTIQVPVLVMHSSSSKILSVFSKEAMSSDIVLNIEDIKRVGLSLGEDVTLMAVENAQHDIFLSTLEVRSEAFKQMFSWLEEHV